MIRQDYLERFTALIDPQPSAVPFAGCWIWRGTVNTTSPYGHAYVGHKEERWAHRISYRHTVGEIPDGLELDHLCNTPLCVNPFHLEPVTPEENARRAIERRPENPHGTLARFWNEKCRCEDCHAEGTRYRREYVAKVRAEAAAGLRPIPHGTAYGYNQLACRCDECRRVKREDQRTRGNRTGLSLEEWRQVSAPKHGTTSMYTARKCRCDPCRENWNAYWREHRRRQREQEQAS